MKFRIILQTGLMLLIGVLYGISFVQLMPIYKEFQNLTIMENPLVGYINGLFTTFILLGIVILILYIFILFLNYDGVKLQEQIDIAALDVATGLYNKGKCAEKLANPSKKLKNVCVFMIDLNSLKFVNDSIGHDAGDRLIHQFAYFLKEGIPNRYFIGRNGGDEFIVICENIRIDEIPLVLQKTNALINEYNSWDPQVKISYASGYAYSNDYPKKTLMELLKIADAEMYKNKEEIKRRKGLPTR